MPTDQSTWRLPLLVCALLFYALPLRAQDEASLPAATSKTTPAAATSVAKSTAPPSTSTGVPETLAPAANETEEPAPAEETTADAMPETTAVPAAATKAVATVKASPGVPTESEAVVPVTPAVPAAASPVAAPAVPASVTPMTWTDQAAVRDALPARASPPLTVADFNRLSAANQRRIQQALFEIYKDHPDYMKEYGWKGNPLSDSIVGPITLSWLNRFLKDFRIEAPDGRLSDDTIEALVHFAAIAKAYPDWKTTLLSDALARWIDRQPQPLRGELYRMRLSGSAQQVIALLDMYRADGPAKGKTPSSETWRNWIIHTYRLDDADLKLLASKNQAIAEIAVLQDEPYANRQLLSNAVRDALKETAPGQDQWLLPVVEQYSRIEDEEEPGHFIYIVTADVLKQIQSDPRLLAVPPAIIAALTNLQAIDYPRQDLFRTAAQVAIASGIGTCPANRSEYARKNLPDRSMTAEAFASLKQNLPADLFSTLEKYRMLATACTDAEKTEADAAVGKLNAMYQASIESQAKKMPLFDPSVPISWDGGTCGCVLDELAGSVYGFYPFWLSGEKQQIDFSLLSRAGYVGLSFDERGNLVHLNERQDGQRAENGMANTNFVATAHRFRTRMDWVFYKNDWTAWNALDEAGRQRSFDALADNIAVFLDTKLTDPVSRAIPWLSLGGSSVPVQGDGVTLYFDDYPTDALSVTLFDRFIDRLMLRFSGGKQSHAINLLLPRSAMKAGKGIHTPEHMVELIDKIGGAEPEGWSWSKEQIRARPHFMIFIEEPTADSKKQLRLDIENTLHGAAREKLLRQIVPVIEFDGRNWQQFEDDVIYLKDNFGGIGLWPLSYQSGPPPAVMPAHSIEQTFLEHYLKPGGDPDLLVCRIVCPNRWLFRTAWNLSFGLGLLIGGLYLWNCRCRARIEKHYLLYLLAAVVPPFALGMVLLSCDPYLEQVSRGNWPFIGLFALMLGFVAWRYMNRKMNATKP